MGSTTIAPGESTAITIAFTMHEGMGGPHRFDLLIRSNDPVAPEQTVTVKATYPK